MSLSEDEFSRLFRVRKTTLKLLQDRKYTVIPEMLEQPFEAFKAEYGALPSDQIYDHMSLLFPHESEEGQNILVWFSDKKLNKDDFTLITTKMDADQATRAIVITTIPTDKLTAQFRENVVRYNAAGDACRIECFDFRELIINITEHVLVPKHIPLSPAQITELLNNYKLKRTQLPRMQTSDPIAKYYGLKKGDVVKIIRQSETAGRYVTYRVVM